MGETRCRVGWGYSELGLFGKPWYVFDILSNLTSPIFWLFNIDIEGMILVYHRCMMVVLLLQLQLQHQNKITRFRLVKVTNAKNFVFFSKFFSPSNTQNNFYILFRHTLTGIYNDFSIIQGFYIFIFFLKKWGYSEQALFRKWKCQLCSRFWSWMMINT